MEEPVEIDIILRQNVDTEADKASKGIDKLSSSSSEARRQLEESLKLQRDVIARLKKELEPLEQQFKKINVGTQDPKIVAEREKLSKAVRALRGELKGEEAALLDLEKAHAAINDKQTTLLTQMRNIRNEMAELKLSGQGETEMYREKEEQLRTLATAHRELTNEQKLLSQGGANLQGFLSGLSALTGLLSAGGGALGLFNTNSEEYAKIQTRVQSLMAITIGLQQVQNTLHSTSAFRIQTVSKVTTFWTRAQTALNVQLGISAALASALMTAGIGLLIGGIAILVNQYQKWKKEQNEINQLKKEYIQLEADTAKAMAGEKVKIQALASVAGDYNKSLEVRRRAIEEMKRIMPEYNGFIDNEGKLVDNADVALKNYLVTLYKVEKAKKLLASLDEKQGELDALRQEGYDDELKWYQKTWVGFLNMFSSDAGSRAIDRFFKNSADKYTEEAERLAESIKNDNKTLEDLLTDTTIFDSLFGSTKVEGRDKPSKSHDRLLQLSADMQRETDAAVIAAMQDGLEKKIRQLNYEYDQRKALIKQREDEIKAIEEETGESGDKQRQQLADLAEAEKKKFDNALKAVQSGAASAIAGIMDEVDARFQTQHEHRIAEIDRFYAQQKAKAKENGATLMELDEIALAHKRDVELEKQFIALETLDFEEQINLKRAQLEDRRVMLASQREEKILQTQIQAAEKRLKKLREIEANGGDVAQQIAGVTSEIEAMNAALALTPAKKLKEMADMMQQVLDGIGDFASIFDEDLGTLFDFASGTIGGVASLGTGIMTGDPQAIIDGAMQLLETAGKVIRANKEANEEIKKFNMSLAQQAIDYSLAVIRAMKDVKSETDSIFTESFTNKLSQGMAGYSAAIDQQAKLMNDLRQETIKTGVEKKKFLGITYGTRDVYSSLLKTYPELINKDGTLNRELAESLKASGNLKEETVDLIDNILSFADAANEAMQAFESELQSLVGQLGNELKKALDDAFMSGTDSAQMMTENVVNLLKDISTQKLFNAVFGGIFNELEDRMQASFGEKGDRDLTDDINWFVNEYGKYVEDYNKGLEQFRQAMEQQYGTDPFAQEGGRQAVARGIAQASQDSIDELNGRLTFLVMKVTEIAAMNGENSDQVREQLFVQRAMLGVLEVIAENSFLLNHLINIREDIERMAREGINLKR